MGRLVPSFHSSADHHRMSDPSPLEGKKEKKKKKMRTHFKSLEEKRKKKSYNTYRAWGNNRYLEEDS